MTDLASAIAAAGGIPSAFKKDDPIGTTITGTIESAELRPVTSFDTGKPEYWDNGDKKEQVSITLQTSLHDPSNPEDDGRRRVYVKWWGEQKKALVAAVYAAGDKEPRIGGTFTATFSGEGEPPKRGFNAPKLYTYQYVKPPSGLAQAVAATPAQQAPVQPAAEQWGPPPTPAVDPALESKVAQMRGLGLTDGQIAAALGIDEEQVNGIPF